ncbi:T9SS type A sorting domain-containing protein [Polaribacter litorisediminis]|uniref:T9SS type A sorting domain-containing protein n=1 Tax=Polaribacter litorisediminis TaxID=1908341 RepID=UPI001CBB5B42|nr:T9SS type A sorting domain-containing protein [Polaribacter litorisediminis]UAM97865.1 T9SS type A sorting domain-containing protein [Polaribacter litorisediminis]
MKKITLLLSLFTFVIGFSQSLPINFEGDVATSDLVSFDGGTAIVTDNPEKSGINTSDFVAQIIRDGGAIYGGGKILLTDNLDFSELTKITMKVYTTAPVGTIVKFKLEGTGPSAEVDAFTTVSGAWETLEWVFLGTPNTLNELVFMFDFGNVGDGSANSTFYFDDIAQVEGPTAPKPTSLPLDFESDIVDTDFLNYSGATVNVIDNPEKNDANTSDKVGQVVRDGGDFLARSTVFLSNNLDLSTMWHISMNVFTTAPVGTRIKLELEGAEGRTNSDYLTTTSGEWETISWNFSGQTKPFNKISFSFDFGNVGDGSATSTFLFDDVKQIIGAALPEPIPTTLPVDFEASVVTSDFINEDGGIMTVIANPYVDENNPSATVGEFVRSGGAPWAKSKLILTSNIDFSTQNSISMKVYTDAPVGALLKLKVESIIPNEFADERDAITTVSGAWATYTWSFPTDRPPLYSVLSLMLGYNTQNDASANATFLIDDIAQTSSTLSTEDTNLSNIAGIYSYPNPAKEVLTFSSENKTIASISLFDILGNQVAVIQPNSLKATIDVSTFASGVYIAKITTPSGSGSMKLIIE